MIINNFVFFLIEFSCTFFSVLISVAFLTLFERKILASIQKRKGPNVVGFLGLLQPIADALKLLSKETIVPNISNKYIFIFSPLITFILSLLLWIVIPFSRGAVVFDISLGVLYLLGLSSLSAYGIIMSGWSSNSRYAFLGSLRSTAQMISYEVSIGIILLSVALCSHSLNLSQIVLSQSSMWYVFPLFPSFLLFLISAFAETNRSPFDLPEAEAELVSGYNVEYSSAGFVLFFIAEYSNILVMSSLVTIFFYGGWLLPSTLITFLIDFRPALKTFDFSLVEPFSFSFKTLIFLFLFVWVRASLPRFRYDQLMQLGWKSFLPISLSWLVFVSCTFFTLNSC